MIRGIFNSIKKVLLLTDDVINYYKKLTSSYPIKSIEDPFAEEDWNSWKKITKEIGAHVQIVGDGLFVTNTKRLEKGVKETSANCILVKPNQIGTLTETLKVISIQKANLNTIISHRSGDTEDTFIASVGRSGQNPQAKKLALRSLKESSQIYNKVVMSKKSLENPLKWLKSSYEHIRSFFHEKNCLLDNIFLSIYMLTNLLWWH